MQPLLRAASAPLGCAALPVDHPKTDEAEYSTGQACPDPRRRPTDEEQYQGPREPGGGSDAYRRSRIGEATGEHGGTLPLLMQWRPGS